MDELSKLLTVVSNAAIQIVSTEHVLEYLAGSCVVYSIVSVTMFVALTAHDSFDKTQAHCRTGHQR